MAKLIRINQVNYVSDPEDSPQMSGLASTQISRPSIIKIFASLPNQINQNACLSPSCNNCIVKSARRQRKNTGNRMILNELKRIKLLEDQ